MVILSTFDHIYGRDGHIYDPQRQECTAARVHSAGWRSGDAADFYLNDMKYDMDRSHSSRRGINIVVVDPASHHIVKSSVYDTWTDKSGANAMMKHDLESLAEGTIVLVAVKETGMHRLTEEGLAALQSCGAKTEIGSRNQGYALIGVKGGVAMAEHRDWSVEITGVLPRKVQAVSQSPAVAEPAAEIEDEKLNPLLLQARRLALAAPQRPSADVGAEAAQLLQAAAALRLSEEGKRHQLRALCEEARAVARPAPQAPSADAAEAAPAPCAAPEFRALLGALRVAELQYLRGNAEPALDDWLLELERGPAGRGARGEEEEARRCLALEEQLAVAVADEAATREQLQPRRAAVEQLLLQTERVQRKCAPQELARGLAARAHVSDEAAEDLLSGALEGAELDGEGLGAFREQFLEQKRRKHWRLALQETLA